MTPREAVTQAITEAVAPYGVTADQLLSHRKPRMWSIPRQMAYALVKDRFGYSNPHLGRLFNGRDHTTILHGIRQHRARMAVIEFLIDCVPAEGDQLDLFRKAA